MKFSRVVRMSNTARGRYTHLPNLARIHGTKQRRLQRVLGGFPIQGRAGQQLTQLYDHPDTP